MRDTAAQLRAAEDRFTRLNADPATPLAEIAAEVRRVEALARERNEARALIDGLERRTRELRTAWLKNHADAVLLIEGHCDERGTDEYNVALGERRAKSVREVLAASGIPAERIVTTWPLDEVRAWAKG